MKKLILLMGLASFSSMAANIKIAAIIPKGTNWANTLKEMAKEVKDKTKGKVKFKVYYGGVQGDEPDVLRKTRIGQLHGGVFTGKTLGEIYGDIRSIEVPFNFYDDEKKALAAIKDNESYFNEGIEKEGFVNLGFYGIGKVYVVSTKKVTSLNEMKGVKIWAWEGDKLIKAMMDSIGLVSVPIALPDVMSSLSTGMLESAYAPPLGILGLQWQNKVKYLIDFPVAYSIGAFLVSKKAWKKVSPENQKIIRVTAKKYIDKANQLAIDDNKASLETLKGMGIEFVSFSKKDLAQAETIRGKVIEKLKGNVLSPEVTKKMESMR